jgi:hypothetical protein
MITMDTQIPEWILAESKSLELPQLQKQETLDFVEGTIYEIIVDFSLPFAKVQSKYNENVTQAVVPVKYQGKDMIWWVNIKNPIYKQLIDLAKIGKNAIKVVRTGKLKATRYNIVN